MAIKNWVPCFIRIHQEEPRFVKVLRDTISYSGKNSNLIVVDKAKGFGNHMKKIPKKMTEPVPIDSGRVAFIPNGVDNGLKNKEGIKFVCCARDLCHEGLLKEFNDLNKETVKLQSKIEKVKTIIDEYIVKMKEERGEAPLKLSELQEELKNV